MSIIDASADDDALYPVLSTPDAPYPIELTPEDGRAVYTKIKRVSVLDPNGSRGLTKVVDLPTDIKWELLVTDARVLVYCVKYDKGGGWWGVGDGAIIALGANLISHALAAHRRKGKVLTGHVRYNWIRKVGGSPKNGWLDNETVRLLVDSAPGGDERGTLFIDLHLAKQTSAVGVAHDIATRCAGFRLSHDSDLDEDERSRFLAIASSPELPATVGESGEPAWAWYRMPTWYRVNRTTAKPDVAVGASAVPSISTPRVAPSPGLIPAAIPAGSVTPIAGSLAAPSLAHTPIARAPVGSLTSTVGVAPARAPDGPGAPVVPTRGHLKGTLVRSEAPPR